MKKGLIFLLTYILTAVACSDDKLSADEEAYVNAISEICMEWGADKQTVASYMKDNELKYEGNSVIDFFLTNKDYVVVYSFDNKGLCSSVLRASINADVSLNAILEGWKYLGSSLEMDEGTMITSMVDIYIKNDILATTYTIKHKRESYRIIGFAPTKSM